VCRVKCALVKSLLRQFLGGPGNSVRELRLAITPTKEWLIYWRCQMINISGNLMVHCANQIVASRPSAVWTWIKAVWLWTYSFLFPVWSWNLDLDQKWVATALKIFYGRFDRHQVGHSVTTIQKLIANWSQSWPYWTLVIWPDNNPSWPIWPCTPTMLSNVSMKGSNKLVRGASWYSLGWIYGMIVGPITAVALRLRNRVVCRTWWDNFCWDEHMKGLSWERLSY
jgi:hypothetical protein